ncbi:zinc ribbon-containing protein [Pseudoalteromonas xiamenensis]|uniref:Zinc ribbon-containing protein n=1 Tax=Pseudoalteromonas xiamenensis TaxID=882626 RepID=A0A975HND1_9GAMM|nr:hypothetical protein [Pseudoalteromonas xiamenensis]QTH72085.1 hypothetical protein J5O05_04110 [Pseudoalteromonas xiamenensis]
MFEYRQWLEQFSTWLKDVNEHEVKDLVARFMEYQDAFSKLSADRIAEYRMYLLRDLEHFNTHRDKYSELAWQEFQDSLWYELSQLEDRTQLEWHALLKDFEHDGVYKAGDSIALGRLVCKNCGHNYDVFYAQTVLPCTECGQALFVRKALHP